ncbi:MAG: hypothetical protein IPQ07_17225 [Myxococcales bacterium]|nr:hypothetical protein [Myxococcales bacterium]
MRISWLVFALAACRSPQAPAPSPASPAPGPPVTAPATRDVSTPDATVDLAPDAAVPAVATQVDAGTPDAEPFDCAEPCTDYAVCWEHVNKGRDFAGGRNCSYGCEHMTPEERTSWLARVAAAVRDPRKCKRLVED